MIQNFVSDNLDHLKGLCRSNRVHEHVAMDPNEMFRVQDGVFILPHASVSLRHIETAIAGSGDLIGHQGKFQLTCPAVSMISVAYSCPLYLMALLKVFSMVG